MNYKLINRKTNEEHLCEKVTIDGWDYYVSDEKPKIEYYGLTKLNTITKIGYGFDYKLYKKVIATNNPSIDIPKVVDEVEELVNKLDTPENLDQFSFDTGFISGYNKSQETHPFSAEDMVEFLEWANQNEYQKIHGNRWCKPFMSVTHSTKELLQLWKSQRHKVVYYQ